MTTIKRNPFRTNTIRAFGPDPDPAAAPPPAAPPADPPGIIKKTQAELDKMVGDRIATTKRDAAKREAELLEQLKSVETDAAKSAELQKQLDDANARAMTVEQAAHDKLKKAEIEWSGKLKASEEREQRTFSIYASEKISRELTDAAVGGDAFRPNQVVAMLQPQTTLVDELDASSKPTGRKEVKVKVLEKGTILHLSPPDAVKRMREDKDNFGNLFKNGVVGGTGTTPAPRPMSGGQEKKTAAEYQKEYLDKRK